MNNIEEDCGLFYIEGCDEPFETLEHAQIALKSMSQWDNEKQEITKFREHNSTVE